VTLESVVTRIVSSARALLLAAALMAVAHVAAGQETINQASISGRVVDEQGMVVPGADVRAVQANTNVAVEAVTDSSGRFRFVYLKPGPYTLTVTLQGFADVTRRLTLSVGSAFELPIVLKVAGLDTSVSVVGEVPVLEAARSQIAGTIARDEVETVPLNGRNFLDLALLVPGVSPTNTASTQLFAETSAVPGQGISVGSQRNLSNNFIVDGLSANDDAAGLSGIPYTVDSVDQFQVITSGGQAELGRALGGYVNVVTRSGTNQARRELYGYFRDDSLNSRNALTGTALPMSQRQFGASVGGPIVKNRTFYFSNVERRVLRQSGVTTIAPADVDAINTRLAATGYPGQPVSTGIYSNPITSTNVLGKIDHQVSGREQLTLRYSLYDLSSSNARGAGGLNAPSASTGLDNRDQDLAVSHTWTLSSRTINETRAQIARSNLGALSTDPIGPAVAISGVAAFGTSSTSPQRRQNTMVQVVDSISHQRGAHALKFGVDLLFNSTTIDYPRAYRGSYAFASLPNFLAGVYNNLGYTQTFGVSTIHQNNPNAGFYAQDEWKPTASLTLNLGLRYDLQKLETIDLDTNNVSPRLGFAWTPFAARTTVIRGGAGLYFDRVPLRAVANALLSARNTTDLANLQQINVGLSPGQAGAPVFPGILTAAVPSVTLVNLTTMDRSLQNAYSRQASLEIERQLGARATVSAGYQYVKGMGLLMSINQNVPACVATGTNNGCRPIAAYANNNRYSAAGTSTYHGLSVSFVQRPATWGTYRVSYTLSKSMNDVGEFFFSQPIDPFDLSKDWGRSDDDQRHRLTINGALTTPTGGAETLWQKVAYGFELSGMLQAYSSLPFNITSGVTTVQGTTARPIVNGEFIPRNAGIGSDYFALNLRLARRFDLGSGRRLEASIEGFNVTNRRNDLTRNTNFGTGAYPTDPLPTFNQVTAVADPRSFQLGVRVSF
jgi:outer membrane receptor protein involved in Fe transport